MNGKHCGDSCQRLKYKKRNCGTMAGRRTLHYFFGMSVYSGIVPVFHQICHLWRTLYTKCDAKELCVPRTVTGVEVQSVRNVFEPAGNIVDREMEQIMPVSPRGSHRVSRVTSHHRRKLRRLYGLWPISTQFHCDVSHNMQVRKPPYRSIGNIL